MPRPVKWSRDLHPLRESARHSRTETWSRTDLERLFNVSRASAQNLMKAIGEVQSVGGAHFVERASLLTFLDEMIDAPSVQEALRSRAEAAQPAPARKPLRTSLPAGLRSVMLADLPDNIRLEPGRLEITGGSAEAIVEGLVLLAQAMENDLVQIRGRLEPQTAAGADAELQQMFAQLRKLQASKEQFFRAETSKAKEQASASVEPDA